MLNEELCTHKFQKFNVPVFVRMGEKKSLRNSSVDKCRETLRKLVCQFIK